MNLAHSHNALSDQLQELRQVGDPLAKTVIDEGAYQPLFTLRSNEFFFATDSASKPISALVQDIRLKLETFDLDKINRAQVFFEQHAPEIMGVLGLYSLPYCYAAEEGSKILVKSNYLLANPDKRLQETGDFLLSVGQIDSFGSSGKGLSWILKTRLMHAAIRRQVELVMSYEMPINQEDLMGTNLAFSLIVIRGLRKMGINPKTSEIEDYLYLWKCIGEMLGIEKDRLPLDLRAASVLERCIRGRQFRENEPGKKLTRSLVDYYRRNDFFSRVDPVNLIAAFMGGQVSRMVGLSHSPSLELLGLEAIKLKNFFTDFSQRNFDTEMKRLGVAAGD